MDHIFELSKLGKKNCFQRPSKQDTDKKPLHVYFSGLPLYGFMDKLIWSLYCECLLLFNRIVANQSVIHAMTRKYI